MSRDIQMPNPFPVEPAMQPVRWVPVYPVYPQAPMPSWPVLFQGPPPSPCMFEAFYRNLPPSEWGKTPVLLLSCPCPRCSPWCLSV